MPSATTQPEPAIRVGARLAADPRQPEAVRIFANGAETTQAAAVVVALVIEDLRALAADSSSLALAIGELVEIEGSLILIAGKMRRAAETYRR